MTDAIGRGILNQHIPQSTDNEERIRLLHSEGGINFTSSSFRKHHPNFRLADFSNRTRTVVYKL